MLCLCLILCYFPSAVFCFGIFKGYNRSATVTKCNVQISASHIHIDDIELVALFSDLENLHAPTSSWIVYIEA